LSLLKGPQGKAGLLRGQQPGTSTPSVSASDEGQGDKATNPQLSSGKRTDYEKKATYLGLRHQEALDDMVKSLRRHGLPDDRSMIVRALIDMAGGSANGQGAEDWIQLLAGFCRNTLPGTTRDK
jgi:hypothetical protein